MSLSPSSCPPDAGPHHPRHCPRHLRALFWSLTALALQGFGGVLAVVQRELVEKRQWLTNEEFLEDWAVAQVIPGPNVVNLSIILGERYFGWRGALVGLCGILTFPLLLVLALALVYTQFADSPAVAGALRGMGAVAAGLVAGMGLKLASTLRHHPLGLWVCAALAITAFALIAVLRLPLAWALLLVGGTGCVLTYRKLGQLPANHSDKSDKNSDNKTGDGHGPAAD